MTLRKEIELELRMQNHFLHTTDFICTLFKVVLEDLIYKTNKDMQMDDAITLYPLVVKRLNHIIKELKGE